MFSWLKKVLGAGSVAVAPVTATMPAAADPADPFAIYIEAARDFLGDDPEVIDLMILARDNPTAYEKAQTEAPVKIVSDYFPGEAPIGSLFRDVMMERRHLVYLDWKDGPYEFMPLYDEKMMRLGLKPLTEAQRASFEAQKPGPGADRLYFPNYLHALDSDATDKGHRVLVFDENADSHAFFVVTPDQFARWANVRLGPEHQFFSPEAFVTDQMR